MKLPAAIFSGVFETPKNEGLRQHSGLMVLDFDNVNELLPELRARAQTHPSVVAAFVSPLGKGLKVVVRVRPSLSPLEHNKHHKRLAAHLNKDWGFQSDIGPDVARRCFVSHDPDLFFKESATAWEGDGTEDDVEEVPLNREAERPRNGESEPLRHEDTQVVLLMGSPTSDQWVSWIQKFKLVPTAEHQTNQALFGLNRLAMSFERELERALTQKERQGLFDAWHSLTMVTNPKFVWRACADYWMEFQSSRGGTKVPIDEDGLENAVEAAKLSPSPPVDLSRYQTSADMMLAIGICYQLWLSQKATRGCFFLSCRSLARHLEDVSHVTCSKYLRCFVADGFLEIFDEEARLAVVRSGQRKARRYRWVEGDGSKVNQGREQIDRGPAETAVLTE